MVIGGRQTRGNNLDPRRNEPTNTSSILLDASTINATFCALTTIFLIQILRIALRIP